MMKTVTMCVDDDTYDTIKSAADGQKINISKILEFATMQYLSSSQYVDDIEMQEILNDKDFLKNLKSGVVDLNSGNYTIV